MIDVRRTEPSRMKELLSDKRTWKICEAAHLGLPCVYLTFYTIKGAGDEYLEGHEAGLYKSFEKMNRVVYKFTLNDGVIDDYRDIVLPNLPNGWYAVKQEWMDL